MMHAISIAIAATALAGPLDPPAGSITPTPGPEPRIAINAVNTPGDNDATPSQFKITQPGSYYLEANITVNGAKNGIEIAALHGVTIDLNGFVLSGGINGPISGIIVTGGGGKTGIVVKNGTVRNWRDTGIDFSALGVASGMISGVHVADCDGDGINTPSAERAMIIKDCTAYRNDGTGIVVTKAHITDCTASGNGVDGIAIGDASTIIGCTASDNTGAQISGTNYNLVLNNNCHGNGFANSATGIYMHGTRNRIEGNQCSSTDRGIRVDGADNVIIRNTCTDHTAAWQIAANNVIGPIVNRITAAHTPINGNGNANSTMSTTDPYANFTY